jgi:hypothetical protein
MAAQRSRRARPTSVVGTLHPAAPFDLAGVDADADGTPERSQLVEHEVSALRDLAGREPGVVSTGR